MMGTTLALRLQGTSAPLWNSITVTVITVVVINRVVRAEIMY
jgi:hypothetical protein